MFTIEQVEFRMVHTNGINMRVAELGPTEGKSPAVLFLHGWPESWYSWRRQIVALANAGYRAVAPDMPGFGGTDRLPRPEDYNILNIAKCVTGLLDDIGEKPVTLIGHDWGAAISWLMLKLHPDYCSKLVTLSVPYFHHSRTPPLTALRKAYGENFFYQIYFQEPGVAEAEFEADPEGLIRRLYCSPDTERHPPQITDPAASAGGWIGRLGMPKYLPDWFTAEDLAYYVGEFKRTGFSENLNYYRNMDRNWELMAPYADKTIDVPTLFMAGEKDFVIRGADEEQLMTSMRSKVPNLKKVVVLPGVGHWIQQEAAGEVNRRILDFLGADDAGKAALSSKEHPGEME